MPRIQVMATFTVSYTKTITKAQLKKLEAGTSLDEIIDESDPYEQLRSSGDCDMDWEPIPSKPRKKKRGS